MSSWSRFWKVRRKQIATHSLRFRSAHDLQSAFGASFKKVSARYSRSIISLRLVRSAPFAWLHLLINIWSFSVSTKVKVVNYN